MSLKQLVEESRFEEAVALIRAALEQGMRDPAGADRLLDILAQLARGLCDWGTLLWALQQRSRLRPADLDLLNERAQAASLAGDAASALILRQTLIEAHQSMGQGKAAAVQCYHLARVRIALGLPEEAADILTRAVTLDPDHRAAALLLRLLEPHDRLGLRVVQAMADPEAHTALISATRWVPSPNWIEGKYGRRCLMHTDDPFLRHDAGFVVADEANQGLLRVDLMVTETGIQGLFGPIQLVAAAGWEGFGEKARALALSHLDELIAAFGGRPAVADHSGSSASALGAMMFKRGYVPRLQISMDIDLTLPEDALWKGIRASNRPYIRKGEAQLCVQYVNADTRNWELLDQARLVHYRYDGTPMEKIFYVLPEWRRFLSEGRGEFAVYSDGDEVQAVVLVIDEGETAIYTFSRYARGTRIRVGPFALWNAIRRARQRGCRRFHLGVAEAGDFDGGKRRNIADFKSGFTDQYRYEVAWGPAD